MAFLPLDKKLHPDFAIPNKKPVGATEIDRNNSLSRDLLIYNDGSGRIGANKANSGISSTTAKATRSTQNLIFDGTDDTILYPNSYTTSDIHTGITQVIRFRILGGVFPTSSDRLIQATSSGINNSPAGGINFNVGASVQLISSFYNGSGYINANAPSGKFLDQYTGGAYQWFTVAVRIDPVADTISLWQQGEAVTTTTSAGVSGASFGADEFFIASGRDLGNYPNIEVDYVGVWNRALSDFELAGIHREPYQILKPVTQTGYFVPSVASGNFTLTADSGAYTYSGTAAGLVAAKILTADSGSYAYTGTSVDLNLGRSLAADSGAYNYTGTAATLTFASSGAFTLAADSGAYVYSGTAAGLIADRVLTAASGSYTYTGTAATLTQGFSLTADSGAYVYTGTAVGLLVGLVLVAESGAYTYNGTSATLDFSGNVWTVQPDSSTTWTLQTDTTTTWDIK